MENFLLILLEWGLVMFFKVVGFGVCYLLMNICVWLRNEVEFG